MSGPIAKYCIEILVADISYPEGDGHRASRAQVIAGIEEELADLDTSAEYGDANLGAGAHWPFILVTLGSTFLLGEKIEKNLQAWIRMAGRFGAAVKRLIRRFRIVYVDGHGADLLALLIAHQQVPDLESLHFLTRTQLPLRTCLWNDRDSLSGMPDALYIRAMQVDRRCLIVVGIRATGAIEFEARYGLDQATSEWVRLEAAESRVDEDTR